MFGKYKKNNYNRENIMIFLIGIKKDNINNINNIINKKNKVYNEINIELMNVLYFKSIH